MLTRRRLAIAASASVAAAPTVVRARDVYPSRTLRLIVPWPPGGGVDTFGRIVQAALAERLGQSVVIENIGGGSGRIGNQAAARATPDGYTLMLVNDSFAATDALPLPGIGRQRPLFDPVTLAASGPQGVFTHPRSGLRSIEELAAAARTRPAALNVGVPGIASSQHLTSELLLRAAGDLRVTHIPYRGGGPLMQDLIAGNVDAAVVTFAAGAQHIGNGSLMGLAVTGARRQPSFPTVPTIGETIAWDFVQETLMGFFVPKGTPQPYRQRLHDAIAAALREPAVAGRLRDLGFEPVGADGAVFARLFDDTVSIFADIATDRQIAAGD
ncbi:MAG: tripartite tricarboxylate transporter substrate binding protein [Enhydrobacter sp.]|nr:tripartite tricarboxylate transporter substrate binding protein [Enhydrobacter sp.]